MTENVNFVMLRHGSSVANEGQRFEGWEDVGLSKRGTEQAQQAGLLLRRLHFTLRHYHGNVLQGAIMELHLQGKTVLITGASQGIGEGIAFAFAHEGCRLKLVSRSICKLEALAQRLFETFGVKAETLAVDLTASGSISCVKKFAEDVDVLVNNAGAIESGDLWEIDDYRWRESWELKVFGYIGLIRAIYPMMKNRRSGVILNNIGIGGENPDFNYIAGSTANAALMTFTKALGGKSLDDGVRVVGVNPGPVMTEKLMRTLKQRANCLYGDGSRYFELLQRYPLGRAASVSDIADMFVFLASDRSAYMSGTIITIDGGISSRRSVTYDFDL